MDVRIPAVPGAIESKLDTATDASLDVIIQALRGALDLEDRGMRARLAVASSTLSTWGRHEQTQTARFALNFRLSEVMAPKSLPETTE